MPDDLPAETVQQSPPSTNADMADKVVLLERARADAERRAAELEQKIVSSVTAAIDQRFKQLEGEKPDPNDPLGTLKDEDLKQVVAQGAEENPQRYAIAQEELWKRRERKLRNEIEAGVEQKLQAERNIALTVEKMKQRFGEDIVKEGSALRTRAQFHMSQIMARKGPQAAWDPSEQERAAEAAHNDMLQEELKKARKDQKELAEYKKQAAMERGNQAIARPGDDVKAHLKKGEAGVTAAIKALNLWDRLGLHREPGV